MHFIRKVVIGVELCQRLWLGQAILHPPVAKYVSLSQISQVKRVAVGA